jgi:dipeptidyl aminopeptidase/acylaminoacyl peptidase
MGFDIHPDGEKVAFSWNKSGRWEIYLASLDGSSPPRQISEGSGSKFGPHWSPDGRKLAYGLDLDGGENYDIYVYDLQTGKHENVTPDTPDAITTEFSWSPDGKQIAFTCDRDGRFDTYIIPAEGGEMRKVLDLTYPDFWVYWSPNGTHLAVVCEAAGQDFWTFIVNLESGESAAISLDGEPISAMHPSWSADGTEMLFSSNWSGVYQIGQYSLADKSVSWLTEGEGEKEHPDWHEDGDKITYVVNYGPNSYLAVQSLVENSGAEYQIEPGVVYSPVFVKGKDEILFVFDNPRHPCDLWKFSLQAESFTQLTFSLPEDLEQDMFVLPEEVTYPSLDGVLVPALLYRPKGIDEPVPAVVYVHGGPNWLSQITWDGLVQYMVSWGWAVLAPNYRGSTGYGKEWQYGSRFDLGGVDTADVTAGANYLDNEGIARPDKICVTGRSWGGYLTMTCLTQYPKRWAGGAAVVPFLNWFTSHKNSREDLQHWDRENFGNPEDDYDLWYERSPFFFMDKIEAPVQLICGENDVRCPASESSQAAEELKRLGKEVEYILFEGEGHSFLKIENYVAAKKMRAEFIARVFGE